MILYLVRNAEAKSEAEDPSRPLSEKGLRDIKKMASYVSRLNIKVDQILHSTKLRARQTAEVLNENLKQHRGISETDGLAPLDDPHKWAELLKSTTNDTILVGHLPHLGKLASLLLCRDSDRNFLAFKSAGMVCLKREDNGMWFLQWMLTPGIVL